MLRVAERNVSEKLRQLDESVRILIKCFHHRPSIKGIGLMLTGTESLACMTLGKRGRCSMTALARECGVALSSMTGIVDRLVEKGCVRRFEDEEDRRKIVVELDEKGGEACQELLEAKMELITTIMGSLKPEEQDSLLRLLGKAAASLRKAFFYPDSSRSG
jgi:DNA-binding MarR family transcriptional regulator